MISKNGSVSLTHWIGLFLSVRANTFLSLENQCHYLWEFKKKDPQVPYYPSPWISGGEESMTSEIMKKRHTTKTNGNSLPLWVTDRLGSTGLQWRTWENSSTLQAGNFVTYKIMHMALLNNRILFKCRWAICKHRPYSGTQNKSQNILKDWNLQALSYVRSENKSEINNIKINEKSPK